MHKDDVYSSPLSNAEWKLMMYLLNHYPFEPNGFRAVFSEWMDWYKNAPVQYCGEAECFRWFGNDNSDEEVLDVLIQGRYDEYGELVFATVNQNAVPFNHSFPTFRMSMRS